MTDCDALFLLSYYDQKSHIPLKMVPGRLGVFFLLDVLGSLGVVICVMVALFLRDLSQDGIHLYRGFVVVVFRCLLNLICLALFSIFEALS